MDWQLVGYLGWTTAFVCSAAIAAIQVIRLVADAWSRFRARRLRDRLLQALASDLTEAGEFLLREERKAHQRKRGTRCD